MATAEQIALLRLNIGDPSAAGDGTDSFYSDAEIGAFLDAVDGSEPRARVASLRPMVAEAAKATEFKEGDYSEKADEYFDHLVKMLAAAEAEVAVLDGQDAALARGKARLPTRVNVQYVY